MRRFTEIARDQWENGTDAQDWGDATTPDESLLWKEGHPRQVKDLLAMGHLLGLPVKVVGTHRSKSVGLPVGLFRAEVGTEETIYMYTRDNFYDLKLVVLATCPIRHLPYEVAHVHWTQERYDDEKKRSFEYQRPKPERDFPGSHNFDETDYESDAWYSKWSGATLLRADGEIYRCGSTSPVYYEGIDDILPQEVFQRYERGRTEFAVEIPGNRLQLMQVMQGVVRSVEKTVFARRRHEHDVEDKARYEAKIAAGETLSEFAQKDLTEIRLRLEAWEDE